MALPSSLSFGLKAGVSPVKSDFINYSSTHSNYTGTSGVIARIDITPTSGWIDPAQSFLKFSLQTSANVQLDGSAACIFQQASVYSYGMTGLLEHNAQYNVLHGILNTMTCDAQTQFYAQAVYSGASATEVREGAYLNGTETFIIPLANMLGTGTNGKLIPAAQGYTLQLVLDNPATAFRGTATYTVSNLSYVALVHQMPAPVNSALLSANNGQILIPLSTWRVFTSTSSASTSNSWQVALRASSCRNIIITQRDSTILTSDTNFSLSDFIDSGTTSSFQVRLGSSMIPQAPITAKQMMFVALLESFHGFNTTSAPTQITKTTYAQTAKNTSTPGSFMLGLDAESISAGKSDQLLSGWSTLTTPLWIDLQSSSTATVCSVDTWCHLDAVLMIQNGVCSVQT